jgi:hypothetical protein
VHRLYLGDTLQRLLPGREQVVGGTGNQDHGFDAMFMTALKTSLCVVPWQRDAQRRKSPL